MDKIEAIMIRLKLRIGDAVGDSLFFYDGGTGCWESASLKIREWAKAAPDDGSHKVDYTVFFEDGESVNGTLALKRHDAYWPNSLPRDAEAAARALGSAYDVPVMLGMPTDHIS